MKKQLRLIIIIVAAIAVLALALWGISLIPKQNDDISSGVNQTVEIFEVDKGKIQSIKIKNQRGEYTLISDGEGGFYEESIKGFPQYAAMVTSVVNASSKVTAKRLVEENCLELSKYGLDTPNTETLLTEKDGTTHALKIGDEAAGGGYYFTYNGKNDVYTVSLVSVSALEYIPLDLIDIMLTDTLDEIYFEKIVLAGTVREEPITIVSMDKGDEDVTVLFSYDITSPGNTHLNMNIASTFLSQFSGMYAQTAVVLAPTEDQLREYGFDNPYSTVTLTNEGREQTVLVGKVDEDGMAYLMRSDRDIIYKVTAAAYDWIEKQYPELVSNIFLTPYIGDVNEVVIEFGDENYTFKTDYSDETDLTVTYKGAKQDPDNFKRLYQLLVTAYAEEYSVEKAQGSPVLTVTYNYKDGRVDKLELFEATTDARKTVIVVNGKEMDFLMRYTFVERVKAAISDLFNGNQIITDW